MKAGERKKLWSVSEDNNAGMGWWAVGRNRGSGFGKPYDEYEECLKEFQRDDARKDVS